MSLDILLREAAVNDSAIHALIGNRMYLVQFPQLITYPAVAYQLIAFTPLYSHNRGAGQANTGWARYQLTFVADGVTGGITCGAIAAAFTSFFRRWNAITGPGSPAQTDQAANLVLSGRLSNLPDPAQPKFTYMMDVRIFAEES